MGCRQNVPSRSKSVSGSFQLTPSSVERITLTTEVCWRLKVSGTPDWRDSWEV